jgi:hypothetical protein
VCDGHLVLHVISAFVLGAYVLCSCINRDRSRVVGARWRAAQQMLALHACAWLLRTCHRVEAVDQDSAGTASSLATSNLGALRIAQIC